MAIDVYDIYVIQQKCQYETKLNPCFHSNILNVFTAITYFSSREYVRTCMVLCIIINTAVMLDIFSTKTLVGIIWEF